MLFAFMTEPGIAAIKHLPAETTFHLLRPMFCVLGSTMPPQVACLELSSKLDAALVTVHWRVQLSWLKIDISMSISSSLSRLWVRTTMDYAGR